MWWGVLCVLVFQICEQLGQLNKDEYDNLVDFVDYDEDTTIAGSRSKILDQNTKTDMGTSVSKPDVDHEKQREVESRNKEVHGGKDIDVNNILRKFIEGNRRQIEDFAKHRAKKEAFNSETTADINLLIGDRKVVTPITWKALDDSTTAKEALITRTTSFDTSTAIEESKNTVKVITWEVKSENTLIDYSVTQENEDSSSSSMLTTQKDVSTSETLQQQTIDSQTYTKENAVTESTTAIIITEEVSTESTFMFPEGIVNMDITTKTLRKGIGRKETETQETTNWTRPTINYADNKIDVPRLLALLDSVVYDDANRFNLTRKFNETLQKFHIPTCEDFTTTTTPTTEAPSTINFNDAKVVAKCFVCGLDVERVPYSSACADAFAGDFIPLVPLDPKARGQIANFRKYCRYLDVNRVITTEDEPHSVFGRFTGGCSVRWVDLTSIYTQRSCRNRRRAVLGKHFASKRMAKLEMALSDLDNGCIISPMATLLPVSRGISLYARFHACVCTGSWCNKAVATRKWMMKNALIFFVVIFVI